MLPIVELLNGALDSHDLPYASYSKAELLEIVEAYPDFKHETMEVQKMCERFDYQATLLPKFHCDLTRESSSGRG